LLSLVGQITGISSSSQELQKPAPETGRGFLLLDFLNRTAAGFHGRTIS
jgi:hypothetical protein